MESLWIVFTIQLQHHYASTHPPLFWESQLPLVGLSRSKFCRHPTAFHPSIRLAFQRRRRTAHIKDERKQKFKGAICEISLGGFFLGGGGDGNSELVIAVTISAWSTRVMIDIMKPCITVLVNLTVYLPVLITFQKWTVSELSMPIRPRPKKTFVEQTNYLPTQLF